MKVKAILEKINERKNAILEKINERKNAIIAGGVAAVAPAVMAVGASAESSFEAPLISESVTTASFEGILDQMTSLLPVVLPVVVACLAFRKGISFLRGMIAGC